MRSTGIALLGKLSALDMLWSHEVVLERADLALMLVEAVRPRGLAAPPPLPPLPPKSEKDAEAEGGVVYTAICVCGVGN